MGGGGDLFTCPFQLLEASSIPGLMAPSIFNANNRQSSLPHAAICVTSLPHLSDAHSDNSG